MPSKLPLLLLLASTIPLTLAADPTTGIRYCADPDLHGTCWDDPFDKQKCIKIRDPNIWGDKGSSFKIYEPNTECWLHAQDTCQDINPKDAFLIPGDALMDWDGRFVYKAYTCFKKNDGTNGAVGGQMPAQISAAANAGSKREAMPAPEGTPTGTVSRRPPPLAAEASAVKMKPKQG
ncbi:hypothetical protein OHC33_005523 [Knufia fluminis]|uniref:Uncharacterized protein n=1 Tax=Knufia fluminis TaxID=191047 RepID=A0AAN8EE87_9EURO|nr:hypothetical protein OHC33_005523 [Knufia fluminis]